MNAPSRAQKIAWIEQWRLAHVALERVRLDELRVADLARIAMDLNEAGIVAAVERTASTSSGLIEQQRIFHRQRRS